MDKGKHIYKCGEGGMKMFGGTEKIWVWVRGLWKIGKVKEGGIESGYKTKDLITWAGLRAGFAEILAP